jgi:hypothetical protein
MSGRRKIYNNFKRISGRNLPTMARRFRAISIVPRHFDTHAHAPNRGCAGGLQNFLLGVSVDFPPHR